jgi:HK97 family phage major capsid protein
MSKELQTVVDEINKATVEMRSYVDRKIDEAAKGKDDPLVQAAIDKANSAITELRAQYEDLMKASQRPQVGGATGEKTDKETELRKSAFVKFLRQGMGETARGSMSPEELRALSSASDAEGGYLVPVDFQNVVLMDAYNESAIRPVANTGSTSRDKVFMPSLKKPSVAWGVTNVAVSPQDITAGGETLQIHDLRALVLIHNNTLDDAAADVWGEMSRAFSRAIAQAEDDAFVSGDGTNAPQGLMISGITANFKKTGVAGALSDATFNGVDPLIEMLHSLKKVYRRNSTWAMNSTTEGEVRKLKDKDGQYLWQPPVQAGTPATLLGRPVINPEGMPDIAANKFPVVLGDFRAGYYIRDRSGISVQRLVERYAEYDQTGFLIKRRTGGKVAMAEAFVTLKVAA